jgi:hypothetical protein
MKSTLAKVSMFEFLKFGKFGCVELGLSKKQILGSFPSPDGFGSDKTIYDEDIWCYGNIEFQFIDDILFFIFSDYLEKLSGGKKIAIEKWIFEDVSKLNLIYFINILDANNIDYTRNTIKFRENKFGIGLLLASGVKLVFEDVAETQDIDKFMLMSFELAKI